MAACTACRFTIVFVILWGVEGRISPVLDTLQTDVGNSVTILWRLTSNDIGMFFISRNKSNVAIATCPVGWLCQSNVPRYTVVANDTMVGLTVANVISSDGDTYSIQSQDKQYSVNLLVSDTPSYPKLERVNQTHVQCSAQSTSEPKSFRRRMTYLFQVSAHNVSIQGDMMPIPKYAEGPAYVNISCRAKESGSKLFSSTSDMRNVLRLHEPRFGSVENISNILQCNAECNPKCTYLWRNKISGEEISDSSIEDPTTVFCEARNTVGLINVTYYQPNKHKENKTSNGTGKAITVTEEGEPHRVRTALFVIIGIIIPVLGGVVALSILLWKRSRTILTVTVSNGADDDPFPEIMENEIYDPSFDAVSKESGNV